MVDNCCQNGDESKCDFFNYPNKKCQGLVEAVVDQTWSSGLDVYNLYAECAGGISRTQMMKRIAQQGRFSRGFYLGQKQKATIEPVVQHIH